MEYEIKQVGKRIIAGFHMVGPWAVSYTHLTLPTRWSV